MAISPEVRASREKLLRRIARKEQRNSLETITGGFAEVDAIHARIARANAAQLSSNDILKHSFYWKAFFLKARCGIFLDAQTDQLMQAGTQKTPEWREAVERVSNCIHRSSILSHALNQAETECENKRDPALIAQDYQLAVQRDWDKPAPWLNHPSLQAGPPATHNTSDLQQDQSGLTSAPLGCKPSHLPRTPQLPTTSVDCTAAAGGGGWWQKTWTQLAELSREVFST